MRSVAMISIEITFPVFAAAQNPPATTPAPAPVTTASSPAKSTGMYVYPKNQQSSDQQRKDESD